MPWPTAALWLERQRAVWPKILGEAIKDQNIYRQRYAAWMLAEVLRAEQPETVDGEQGRLL